MQFMVWHCDNVSSLNTRCIDKNRANLRKWGSSESSFNSPGGLFNENGEYGNRRAGKKGSKTAKNVSIFFKNRALFREYARVANKIPERSRRA